MGQLPLPNSSPGPSLGLSPPPVMTPPDPLSHEQSGNNNGLISVLRQALADGAHAPEAIFRAAADSARILTGASGTALALRTEGIVICRARSGTTAPPLGAPLDVESGISGKCFRTARALYCDDTLNDDRVDPQLCRQLGIRSIAAVPVQGRQGTVGILEVFGEFPRAFTAEQVGFLEELAAIVEEASEPVVAVKMPDATEARREYIRRELLAAGTASEEAARMFAEPSSRSRGRYWILGGIAVALLLTSAVVWFSWKGSDAEVAEAQPAAPAPTAAQPAAGQPSARAPSPKPGAGRAEGLPGGPSAKSVLRNAAEIAGVGSGSSVEAASTSTAAGLASAKEAADVAPPDVMVAANASDRLGGLIVSPGRMPTPDIPISQGVTEAVLIHKVVPQYPAQARTQRVEGSVVLEATITEEGAMRDVRVVSGPQLLVGATTVAVRQWRYRPSLLNGKPVAVQKVITVVFKAP